MTRSHELNATDWARLSSCPFTLCFGHFNVIHPGHWRYFEHAFSLGLPVVVAISETPTVDGISRELFAVEDRVASISKLSEFDSIIVVDRSSILELIQNSNPKYLLLGNEYRDSINYCWLMAGLQHLDSKSSSLEVIYHEESKTNRPKARFPSVAFGRSSLWALGDLDLLCGLSKSLNDGFEGLIRKYSRRSEKFSSGKKSIAVIGDIIVDKYIFCEPIGISAEAPLMVVNELEEEIYLGGAGIVVRNVSSLGGSGKLISASGQDSTSKWVRELLNAEKIEHRIREVQSNKSTLKTRYVVDDQKIFRTSCICSNNIGDGFPEEVIEGLLVSESSLFAVIFSDFGYGVISQELIKTVVAKYGPSPIKLVGDSQTSSQNGDVSVFRGFDIVSATEVELRSCFGYGEHLEALAQRAINELELECLILKLGADGFVVFFLSERGRLERVHVPALCNVVKDVTGAGDSLLAAFVVALSDGADYFEASVFAACVAGLAVSKIGNTPIQKSDLMQLLNSD